MTSKMKAIPKVSIPGTGFAGIEERVGKNVINFQVGDRVFGETTFRFSANADFLQFPQGDS